MSDYAERLRMALRECQRVINNDRKQGDVFVDRPDHATMERAHFLAEVDALLDERMRTDIPTRDLPQGCAVIRCSQCGCPSVQEPGHDYCQTCARSPLREVERERDEAQRRAQTADEASAALLEAFKIVDPYLETGTMPAHEFDRYWLLFNQYPTERAREFVRALEAARSGFAQRDRRIAELEAEVAELKETLHDHGIYTGSITLSAEDHAKLMDTIEKNVDAALPTAPAQPAPPTMTDLMVAPEDIGDLPDAAPAQPATAAKEHCPRRLMGETVPPHMPCDTGDFSRDAQPATCTHAHPSLAGGWCNDCGERLIKPAPPSPAAPPFTITPEQSAQRLSETSPAARERCEDCGDSHSCLMCRFTAGDDESTDSVISSNREKSVERVIEAARVARQCRHDDQYGRTCSKCLLAIYDAVDALDAAREGK